MAMGWHRLLTQPSPSLLPLSPGLEVPVLAKPKEQTPTLRSRALSPMASGEPFSLHTQRNVLKDSFQKSKIKPRV